MRILFIGTGDIGLPSFEALLHAPEHEVVALVTQPDKPVGRKLALTPPRIKVRATEAGIPVLQPQRLRNAVEELSAYPADVFVVVAYGQILSRAVLDLPGKACLNIHASLLPRHRGAAPIQAAIRDGDEKTGITIMWMDEGLDTGDMLWIQEMPILSTDTGGILHDRLASAAPESLLHALYLVEQGTAPRIPQENALATYTGKLERQHGRLPWDRGAVELERLIRAYNPWPGTHCLCPMSEGKTALLKVYAAKVVEGAKACPAPGTVLEAGKRLLVSCGAGVLELLDVQLEGRKRLPADQFLCGHPLPVGTRLA